METGTACTGLKSPWRSEHEFPSALLWDFSLMVERGDESWGSSQTQHFLEVPMQQHLKLWDLECCWAELQKSPSHRGANPSVRPSGTDPSLEQTDTRCSPGKGKAQEGPPCGERKQQFNADGRNEGKDAGDIQCICYHQNTTEGTHKERVEKTSITWVCDNLLKSLTQSL